MGFKDQVAADRVGVFLDVEFFGEMVRVEGKKIPVVIDEDKLKERKGSQDLAIAESTLLFYVKTEDLPPNLVRGDNLNFNGREYIVDECKDDMGVSTVVLSETVMA